MGEKPQVEDHIYRDPRVLHRAAEPGITVERGRVLQTEIETAKADLHGAEPPAAAPAENRAELVCSVTVTENLTGILQDHNRLVPP